MTAKRVWPLVRGDVSEDQLRRFAMPALLRARMM
jgi:hypothetical protein